VAKYLVHCLNFSFTVEFWIRPFVRNSFKSRMRSTYPPPVNSPLTTRQNPSPHPAYSFDTVWMDFATTTTFLEAAPQRHDLSHFANRARVINSSILDQSGTVHRLTAAKATRHASRPVAGTVHRRHPCTYYNYGAAPSTTRPAVARRPLLEVREECKPARTQTVHVQKTSST
jgi:hypothetical protein